MQINKILLICLLICFTAFGSNAQKNEIEKKVEELLQKMTLDEKIGQMNQISGMWEFTGPPPVLGNRKRIYDDIKSGKVGSMLNVTDVKNIKAIQKLAVENSRLGIPVIFGYDVIHGLKTMMPIPLAEAASWDLEAIQKSAEIGAKEAAAVGINWTFAPMVDISRDPRWGRVMEGAGEDTYLASKIGMARVNGFQGSSLSDETTIAACTKHFAAYGFSESGKDYNTVDIGTYTLYNVVLPPFKATVDAGVKTFMNSFNILNGIPATGNSFLQRDILKGDWGFDGFIVSDWASIGEMVPHGFVNDYKEAAQVAVNAGSDMDMATNAYINYLKTLVEERKISVDIIDDAVRRILKVKFELGLFEEPYKYCDTIRALKTLNNPKHHEFALEMAKKSIVLLKNKNQILPLKKNNQKIAVIGALAGDKDSPLGSWRAIADDNSAISVLEGLKSFKGNDIKFQKGAELTIGKQTFRNNNKINEDDTTGFSAAIELAKNSDIVLMVLGENCFQSGEARNRTKLGLPGVQQQLLEAIHKVNTKIVLVLMNGRPLVLTDVVDKVEAIVETWHLGSQSGNAIAQVLYGEHNPAGKLPMTFPRSEGQIPIYYNYYNTGRPVGFNVFWTHFIDEKNEPLFPFGFGLSYTTFEYSELKIDKHSPEKINVSVSVKNTGKYKGEEVVQLYIRDRVASVVRPVKELKGFEKIELQPGQSKIVNFVLTKNELGFYNGQGKFRVEPGKFDVMVGANSVEGLKGEFELEVSL